MILHVAAGLFALYMLFRHLPVVLRALRGGKADGRGVGPLAVSALNVLLALAILAVAVKGAAAAFIKK